ncbi:MAG: hypothetical protein JNL70_04490 [Saprospiraceae bacterium]|nr:hypothetical protein [Saprospiraceae bacterium]
MVKNSIVNKGKTSKRSINTQATIINSLPQETIIIHHDTMSSLFRNALIIFNKSEEDKKNKIILTNNLLLFVKNYFPNNNRLFTKLTFQIKILNLNIDTTLDSRKLFTILKNSNLLSNEISTLILQSIKKNTKTIEQRTQQLKMIQACKVILNKTFDIIPNSQKDLQHRGIRLISTLTDIEEELELAVGLTTKEQIADIAKDFSSKTQLPIGVLS